MPRSRTNLLDMPRRARVARITAGRGRVRGLIAFRKLLKRLADTSIRETMLQMLSDMGDQVLAGEQADAPFKTGALKAGLVKRLQPGSLGVRVGIVGRPLARRLYYGWILEKGVKAQTVVASRGGAHNAAGGPLAGRRGRALKGSVKGVWLMNIRGRAPRPFVMSQRNIALRDTLGGQLGTFWEKALASAAQGATDA